MATPMSTNALLPTRETRMILIKWIVALLVPLAVFTFVWSGESIINNVLLGIIAPTSVSYNTSTLIQLAIFVVAFYGVALALAGYLVAVDTGRRTMLEVWIDILVFAVVPLLLVIAARSYHWPGGRCARLGALFLCA